MSTHRSTRRGRVLALALALFASCGADSPTEPAALPPLPEGVVMTIGGAAVLEEELAGLVDTLAELRPESTRPDLQRRVLVDAVLPRLGLAARHVEARAAAQAEAANCARRIADGTWSNMGVPIESTGDAFDFFLWNEVRDAAAGEVVGPVESTRGEFFVAIVDRPFDPLGALDQSVRLTGFAFAYLDQTEGANPMSGYDALDGLEARFASDEWRDLLPINVRSRLVERR